MISQQSKKLSHSSYGDSDLYERSEMYSRMSDRYSIASRSHSDRQAIARIVVLLLVAAVVTLGAAFFARSYGTQDFVSLPAGNTDISMQSEYNSTPTDQWQRGIVPILYQKDPQWSSHSYAGSTLSETGCGPACLAMVYVYFTGDTAQSPATIADMATSAGCAGADGTAWLFMTSGAQTLGISAEELPADRDLIVMHLNFGNPIIAVMGAGDFTTEGHFIVLTGINGDNSITIHDPNSVERTYQTWDLDSLMIQFRNLWVYHL